MASISVFVKGHKELDKKYHARAIRLGEIFNKDLSAIGKLLKSDTIKEIKKINGNERETRYNPTRTVTVSKPGRSPNHDRGRLVRGIRAFIKRSGKGKYNLNFQSKAPYALDLEFGTRNMAARPYMRPALKRNRKRIKSIISKGVRRAL
jgi:HK97 gp10 family phage protein